MKPTAPKARDQLVVASGVYFRRNAHGSPADVYLQERGISRAIQEEFMLGWTGPGPLQEDPPERISIPSLAIGRIPVFMSFRAIDPEVKPKYLHQRGDTRLFNPRAIVDASDEIHITEGQLDAVVLEQCGYRAVGVMGAKAWKPHHPRVFAGFPKVFVWCDNDTPGRDFGNAICDSLPQAVAIMVTDAKDVNELFLAGGQDAIREALTRD